MYRIDVLAILSRRGRKFLAVAVAEIVDVDVVVVRRGVWT